MLSLSATPIPRTLQMSLAGLRDISVIETPPEGRRPVRTYVGPYDEDLVRQAIERELERGGQAFFLHNRIDSLPEVAERLRGAGPRRRASPKPTGRWTRRALEETMLDFLRGEADCLVTTTIIESGLDIPTANTLIVERADQLGLSQAYQIRGRVGRSRERAFAYLLYPSAEALTEEAAARLSTLADHTELGSGFRIAMRDLDIRGAGDLLGDEQSGHVAAVGFELYCQMIDEAVAEAGRGEAARRRRRSRSASTSRSTPTCRPPSSPSRRRRSTSTGASSPPASRASCGRSATSSSDRFGPLPPQAENLLALQRARIELGLAGARSVELRGGRLSVTGVELDSEQAGVLGEQVEGALYEWREQTAAVRVARRSRGSGWRRCLAMAEGLREAEGDLERGSGYAARPRESEQGQEAHVRQGRGSRQGRRQARTRASGGRSASRLLVFGALFVAALRRSSRSPRASATPSVPSGDVARRRGRPRSATPFDKHGLSEARTVDRRRVDCASGSWPQAGPEKTAQARRQKVRRTGEGGDSAALLDNDLDPGRGRRTGNHR